MQGELRFLFASPRRGRFGNRGRPYFLLSRKSGLETLAARAKELACDVALYGHTHTPLISEVGGVTLVNPGSLRFDVGAGGSYAYLVVNGKKVTAVLVGENPK